MKPPTASSTLASESSPPSALSSNRLASSVRGALGPLPVASCWEGREGGGSLACVGAVVLELLVGAAVLGYVHDIVASHDCRVVLGSYHGTAPLQSAGCTGQLFASSVGHIAGGTPDGDHMQRAHRLACRVTNPMARGVGYRLEQRRAGGEGWACAWRQGSGTTHVVAAERA